MVNKVTIKGAAQAELMFGPVQAAIAKAVLDSVQERVIPAAVENELMIIASVYIHVSAAEKKSCMTTTMKRQNELLATQ